MSDEATDMLRWLVSMGDPDDAAGLEARRTVTLTEIVDRARAALAAHDSTSDDEYTPTREAAGIPTCEHHWVWRHQGDTPMPYIGVCSLCGRFNAEDLREWLAAHDAEVARVLPSVEDVARAIDPACDDRPVDEANWPDVYRVLALIADAPSREQVEREAAEKALRDAADEWSRLERESYTPGPGGGIQWSADTPEWLTDRADRLAAGGEE